MNIKNIITIEYFDMYYPILGIKKITIGFKNIKYVIEKNPVTNRTIRTYWYIKYITKFKNGKIKTVAHK